MAPSVAQADSFQSAKNGFSSRDRKSIDKAVRKIQRSYSGKGLNREQIKPGIFTYRANRDIRIVTMERDDNVTLVYVAHHDDAYKWIDRQEFKETPSGAILLRETKIEVVEKSLVSERPTEIEATASTPELLDQIRYSENQRSVNVAVRLVLDRLIDRNEKIL